MKKIYFLSLIASLVLLSGCSTAVDEGNNTAVNTQAELSIGLPIGISRTAMDSDGKASWTDGDTFALWAENRTGAFPLNGAEFKMMYYWHSMQSAVFTSNANPIAEGTYTYYAVSPMPQTVNNQQATYTIPAEQQGDSFNGAYDIMVATPLEAGAVVADKVNNLALDFQHKMHVLKMTIAENNFSYPLAKVKLEFPSAVVGDLVFDVKNLSTAPAVSNEGKSITINTNGSANVGDTIYGFVIPTNINGEVKLTAISPDGQSSQVRTFNMSKELKAGHITPMSLVIPDILRITTLRFSIGQNNLGEAVQKLTIIDHNGKTLGTFNTNSSNTYEVSYNGYYESSGYGSYAGKTFTARFESAHAIVEQQFTMPAVAEYTTTTVPAITVPYLFFEDFTSIHTDFEKDDVKSASSMKAAGMLLNDYMSVAGWNAARVKGMAGLCVRINVRCQSTVGYTHANGRLDTPNMSGIKAGTSAKVKVMFDMGCYINSDYGTDDGVTFCMTGTHTKPTNTAIDGADETTAIMWVTINDVTNISSLYDRVCFTSKYLNGEYAADDFDSTFDHYEFEAENCTSATRISWSAGTTKKTSAIGKNAHYYLYIDNIKVQIVQ